MRHRHGRDHTTIWVLNADVGPHAALPQKRQEEFTSYKDYIGMDITSLVTLPVWIMEPFTILQRLAEIMEYTDQLDRAAGTEDQYER